ncbi:MAG: DegQ family serine endoprotease [bacterium]|nr:MAG: DegQ family serine endoprotease [bacterium]
MKNINRYKVWITCLVIASAVFLMGLAVGRGDSSDSPVALHERILVPQALAQERFFEGIPDMVERAVPAVVNIQSKKVVRTREGMMHPFFSDPFFRRFFGDEFFRRNNVPRERVERNLGSGVIVTNDGYILTNNHLVDKAEEVSVVLPDDREYDAEIVGSDPRTDVAVLKIEAEKLPALNLGSSAELRLGETVLAIGYPFGIGQTVTMGIVSALGRANLQMVDYEDFIQTDAAINPGNSGGALINARGELVGINTAILSRSGGNQGIGFAIPIDLAYSVMRSIIMHGKVIRGWLGVSIQDVTQQMAELFELEEAKGTIIAEVVDDSPAMKGGMERGDVVIAYEGNEVEDMNAFRKMVAETEPGTKVEIIVLRDGKAKKLNVRVGEHPDTAERAEEEEGEEVPSIFAGVDLDDLTDYYRSRLDIPDDVSGVIVTEVEANSSAIESGLREGDVITEVNRKKVDNLQDFFRLIERVRGDKVLLLVYRNGSHLYIIVRS